MCYKDNRVLQSRVELQYQSARAYTLHCVTAGHSRALHHITSYTHTVRKSQCKVVCRLVIFCIFDTCNAKVHTKYIYQYMSRLWAYGCMKTLRLMKVRCYVFLDKEIIFSARAISKGARLFFSTKSLFQSLSICKSCVRK